MSAESDNVLTHCVCVTSAALVTMVTGAYTLQPVHVFTLYKSNCFVIISTETK